MLSKSLYRVSLRSDRNTTPQEVALASLPETSQGRTARSACFALLVGLTLAAFWAPISMLIRFSFQQQQYSHIFLVPLVSASLFFMERKRIFSHFVPRWGVGMGLLFAGALLRWFGQRYCASPSENDQLSMVISSVVVLWVGGFVLCYGIRAFRVGVFPVLFLFLMVPIPDFFLNRAIFWLQTESAEVSDTIFGLVGVPVFRTGFIFSLPGITIEVAKECSGIRSSLALLMGGFSLLFLGPMSSRFSSHGISKL